MSDLWAQAGSQAKGTRMKSALSQFILVVNVIAMCGCSSLGLTLWPSSFPLLRQTKELAAASPRPTGLNHELAKMTLPDYFIEPGDRILVEPTEIDSKFRAIGDQKVQIDGSIDLGQFGRIRVAGLTVEAIEVAIEERIREVSGEPEPINVQLIETNAATVYVLGEVGSPGAYPIDGNETVLDAILLAGGLTTNASPCDIVLVRPTSPSQCRVVLPVCYRQITQIGDATTNYQIQPGDRVVVGARTMCEELAFWKQRSSCEGCACEYCVECAPASVNYSNRIMQFASHFALPRKFKGEREAGSSEASGSADATRMRLRDEAETNAQGSPESRLEEVPQRNSERNNNGRGNVAPTRPVSPPVEEAQIFLPPIEANKGNK